MNALCWSLGGGNLAGQWCNKSLREDFAAIARRHRLTHRYDTKAFVSKVMVFDKPQ